VRNQDLERAKKAWGPRPERVSHRSAGTSPDGGVYGVSMEPIRARRDASDWRLPLWQPVPAAEARSRQKARHEGPRFPANCAFLHAIWPLARELLMCVIMCKHTIIDNRRSDVAVFAGNMDRRDLTHGKTAAKPAEKGNRRKKTGTKTATNRAKPQSGRNRAGANPRNKCKRRQTGEQWRQTSGTNRRSQHCQGAAALSRDR
jgi:hypothetical protein